MSNKFLKPTKQRFFKKAIFGFDIETYNDNKKFLCCSLVGNNYKKHFLTKKDFVTEIKTNPIFLNSYIFATNLSFDFFGMFFNDDGKYFETIFQGSNLLFSNVYIYKNQFVNKELHQNYSDLKSITFVDSMNYAKLSVEKMGNIIGIHKMDKPEFLGQYPKNDVEFNYMIEYNYKDSEITYKFMKFLIIAFESLGATFKKTIASTSLSLFMNKYLNKIYPVHDTHILIELFKAYYGGRTEVFRRGKIKDVSYYDFNSLYPSIMHDYEFPDPNTLRIENNSNLNYILNYEGVSDVEVEVYVNFIPLLPYKSKDKKLIFPIGKFRGSYSHVELRKLIQENLGEVIHIHKTYYYTKSCRPFKNFVDTLYNSRLKYLELKNSMEYVIKICMNSLYGKFGEKFQDKEMCLHESLVNKELLNNLKEFKRVGKYFLFKIDVEPKTHCIPIWAIYVTAYSRIKMFDYLHKYQDSIVYCDTDSLIIKNEIKSSINLGKLKKEMGIKKGIIVRPKFYALIDDKNKDIVKIKGLGRRLDFKGFIGLLDNPIIHYNKFAKFKESIRRGFIPNEILAVHKEFSLEDTKRIWETEFNPNELQSSKPLSIEYLNEQLREKANLLYEKKKRKELDELIDSDKFDIEMVGYDISNEEFIENEKFFEEME
jgi:hypothetical protein